MWKKLKERVRNGVEDYNKRLELQRNFYSRKAEPEPLTEKEKKILAEMIKKE
jgi:hypothetical protein